MSKQPDHDHPDGLGCDVEFDATTIRKTSSDWYGIVGECTECGREFVKQLHATATVPREKADGW
ncbi:hypothetical protein [Halococcus saccharolyticus]|uniref:hypothetical protein n=1 Tax=Halococcus saccharolyticus TaxID=62319 RepID=UPI0012676B3F|nr:hypothetical protein [Halococcus saccharolyticus]